MSNDLDTSTKLAQPRASVTDDDMIVTRGYIFNKLARVATTGNYNDLTNKPNIPASMQGYITEVYKSGNKWYRKWSDGWIEQGGRAGTNGGDINFVTPFNDWSNCTLVASPTGGGHPDDCYVIVVPISRSQFNLRASRFTDVSWYACGK